MKVHTACAVALGTQTLLVKMSITIFYVKKVNFYIIILII